MYGHFITKLISLKQTKRIAHGKFRECSLDTKSFYHGLKDRYFSSLLLKETRKNDTLYTVRQRISLPAFRVRPSSNNFLQIAQSSFGNFKGVKHKYNCLLRQHAATGKDITRDLNGKEHSNLFVATSTFCDKFENDI